MGQTGFCENLRFFCENLRKSAVSFENLRSRDAVIPRKSEDLQKSAKKKAANLAPSLSLSVCPF